MDVISKGASAETATVPTPRWCWRGRQQGSMFSDLERSGVARAQTKKKGARANVSSFLGDRRGEQEYNIPEFCVCKH